MRMGWRDGRGRQGGQGSCWERGGTWLGLPKLLHSPNFQQTLDPHLPKPKHKLRMTDKQHSGPADSGQRASRD